MVGLSPGVGKNIESPLSAFNNLLMQISNKIEKIYFPDSTIQNSNFVNRLLFDEKSIMICGQVKLVFDSDEIGIKFLGKFTDLAFVQITLDHKKELYQLFQNYLYILASMSVNLDFAVAQKNVESIFIQIKENTIDKDQWFILPYKKKINHLYDDRTNDKTLEKIFNRFSYVIKFESDNSYTFKYKMYRVLSSELNESKSLENIRFEEIEILKEKTVSMRKLQHFLVDLFYYGDILN